MSGGWWGGLVAIALLGWTFLVDLLWGFDGRLARWWMARARDEGRWTGPVAFIRSAVLLGAYTVVALLGHRVGVALGDPRWALVLSGPAMLAYAPVVVAMAPTQGGAYASLREELASAGADAHQQRAIAWWAGPPALLGLGAIVATLVTVFAT